MRVPGSGHSEGATSVVCDLGRVSSLAASVTVNPSLFMRPLRTMVPSTSKAAINKLAATEVLASQQCRFANKTSKRSHEASDGATQESKRLQLDVSSPSTTSSSSNHPGAVGVNVQSNQSQAAAASVAVHAGQGENVSATTRRSGKRIQSRLDAVNKALEDLQEERNRLEEENRELMQRLSRYLKFCQGRGINIGVFLPLLSQNLQ